MELFVFIKCGYALKCLHFIWLCDDDDGVYVFALLFLDFNLLPQWNIFLLKIGFFLAYNESDW